MFSALLGYAVVQTNLTILIASIILLLGSAVALATGNNKIMKVVKIITNLILMFFGVFKCQDKKDYCYLGLKLNGSYLAIALLLELGIVIFSAHVAVTLLLLHMGVISMHTLASPIIGYFIYPIVLGCLRKKCS